MKPAIAVACAALIGAGALGGALLVTAPAVAATGGDSHCIGRLIESKPFWIGQTLVGELNLKHNQETGVSCAIMWHKKATYGTRLDTGVTLFLSNTYSAPNKQVRYERGPQRYQAGPVRVYARQKCVTGGGGITYQGTHYYTYTQKHCYQAPVDYN